MSSLSDETPAELKIFPNIEVYSPDLRLPSSKCPSVSTFAPQLRNSPSSTRNAQARTNPNPIHRRPSAALRSSQVHKRSESFIQYQAQGPTPHSAISVSTIPWAWPENRRKHMVPRTPPWQRRIYALAYSVFQVQMLLVSSTQY